ncbi:hypothetical protein LSAT2_017206 [Lamellibrachia satsuma]|nr:hypothetical protein LSAT2_017206 [Lamellibrachia satsuma]
MFALLHCSRAQYAAIMKSDKKTMFPANFVTLLLFTAFCTSADEFIVAAVSASTVDMDMYDTTVSNIITACCTGTGCDTYITPPTPPAVPPTPSAQVISLQWLLDNVDSMIAKVESCCCQDKMTTVNDSSVSVVIPDTTESITLVDETETASTSASPYETSNMPVEVVTVPDGMWCYTCDNAATNEECNEGDLVKCQSNQESCQSELRHSNGQARITKGCKQLQACENNAAGNVNNCPGQNDQSYCVYCCQGYGCNKYLPANPVDVGTKPPFEVEPSMATTVLINPTVVTSSPPSAPPTMAPVTPSVQMETLSSVLDIMDDLLPRLQSCCCGFDMAENQTMTLPDIDVTTSSLDLEHTTERGQPNFDWHENQTSATPPYSDDPVASSITVVITTPPTMAPVTPSVQMETLSTVLDIMDDLLPRLQSCCCGFDMAENQTMTLPDIDVTTSSLDLEHTTERGQPNFDWHKNQTSATPPYSDDPVASSITVVITTPPTMAPVTPSVQMETLSTVLDIMDDLLPRLQSCCCGFDMAENQTITLPDIDVTTSSLDFEHTTERGQPNFDWHKNQTSATPPYSDDPVASSITVVITTPPTMAPVTPSVQMETLSSVLDIMGDLLPRLQSCCCGFDMAENQTSATPTYSDVTMSSPDVDVTMSSPDVVVTMSSPDVDVTMSLPDVVVMTTQEELPVTMSSHDVDLTMSSPSVDLTVSSPGIDVTVSSPGVDVTVSSPGVDVTVSSPGVDVTMSSSDVDVIMSSPDVAVTMYHHLMLV